MPREQFKSDRHLALSEAFPPEPRYCSCGQGRYNECRCEPEPVSKWWVPAWLAVAAVAGLASLVIIGTSK